MSRSKEASKLAAVLLQAARRARAAELCRDGHDRAFYIIGALQAEALLTNQEQTELDALLWDGPAAAS